MSYWCTMEFLQTFPKEFLEESPLEHLGLSKLIPGEMKHFNKIPRNSFQNSFKNSIGKSYDNSIVIKSTNCGFRLDFFGNFVFDNFLINAFGFLEFLRPFI